MRKLAAALAAIAVLSLSPPAFAQGAVAAHGRPWWRLVIFVPAAALVGGGVVVGRRVARNRGWLDR
jgi:hypothetical protein